MVKLRSLIIFVISCSLILADFDAGSHEPSDERGDSNYRRKTNIDILKLFHNIRPSEKFYKHIYLIKH